MTYQHSTTEPVLVAAMLVQLGEPVGTHAWVYDEKLEARVLLEAVVCQGGSEKAGALIAGKPVCEGILVAVYIVAAFARMSAVLQRTSVVP